MAAAEAIGRRVPPATSGMSLIEVVCGIGVFSVLIIATIIQATALGRMQQLNYQRSLAANVAMVIASYRANDMIQRALANYQLGASMRDAADPVFPTDQFRYWNSLDPRNPGATWYGAPLGTAASSYLTTSAATGTTWVDQCPLLDRFANQNNATSPHSGTPTFTNQTTGIMVRAKSGNTGTFDPEGGYPADRTIFRLHRLNQQASSGLNAESYADIFFSFSNPAVPPSGEKVKAHYLIASFWSLANDQVPSVLTNWDSAGNNFFRIRFLGRYAILDSLEP